MPFSREQVAAKVAAKPEILKDDQQNAIFQDQAKAENKRVHETDELSSPISKKSPVDHAKEVVSEPIDRV